MGAAREEVLAPAASVVSCAPFVVVPAALLVLRRWEQGGQLEHAEGPAVPAAAWPVQAAQQSAASATYAMRRFAKRECLPDAEASVLRSLHPPLTLRKRPRDEALRMAPPGDGGAVRPAAFAAAAGKKQPPVPAPAPAPASAGRSNMAEGARPAGNGSGTGAGVRLGGPLPDAPAVVPELPPVVASPRAGRRSFAGSSRPASVHVDDFQKKRAGGTPAAAGAARAAAGPAAAVPPGRQPSGLHPSVSVDLYADLMPAPSAGGLAASTSLPIAAGPVGSLQRQTSGVQRPPERLPPQGSAGAPAQQAPQQPQHRQQPQQQGQQQQGQPDPELTAILQDPAAIGVSHCHQASLAWRLGGAAGFGNLVCAESPPSFGETMNWRRIDAFMVAPPPRPPTFM